MRAKNVHFYNQFSLPKSQRGIAIIILCAFLFLGLVTNAYAFRIFGPNPGAAGDYVRTRVPTDTPPFIHWDLREFNNCVVPWSLGWVPDLDGDGVPNDPDDQLMAFTPLSNAFGEWETVQPAVIRFKLGATPGTAGIRLDDHNLVSWVGAVGGDDVQVAPVGVGTVVPGGIVVNANPPPVGNGFLETQPRDDDFIDFTAVPPVIRSADGDAETTANNQGPLGIASGLTGHFFNNATGVIREADIVLNNNPALYLWGTTGMDWTVLPSPTDIQGVATHEIGHFIGVAHPGDGPEQGGGAALFPLVANAPTMSYDNRIVGNVLPVPTIELRTLAPDDQDAINYLYTPDLGDAPDPTYPSRVHNGPSTRVPVGGGPPPVDGTRLSGVRLRDPATGAEHIFGYYPNYQYEWLGNAIDDHPLECTPRVINNDKFDDGVMYGGALAPGVPMKIKIFVNTSGLGAARYGGDDVIVGANIASGPNGVAGTKATGDDIQAIPVGQGFNIAYLFPGPDGASDTIPQGDDVDAGGGIINTGPNGIAETSANNNPANPPLDDWQVIPVGNGLSNSIVVMPGANGTLETVPNNTKLLFVNAWKDWNGDGTWDQWKKPRGGGFKLGPLGPGDTVGPNTKPAPSDEYILWWAGTPDTDWGFSPNFIEGHQSLNGRVLSFWITPPAGMKGDLWSRFRLDYGEDAGWVNNIDGTLALYTGAAQFGEVEDNKEKIPTGVNTYLLSLLALLAMAVGFVVMRKGFKIKNVS